MRRRRRHTRSHLIEFCPLCAHESIKFRPQFNSLARSLARFVPPLHRRKFVTLCRRALATTRPPNDLARWSRAAQWPPPPPRRNPPLSGSTFTLSASLSSRPSRAEPGRAELGEVDSSAGQPDDTGRKWQLQASRSAFIGIEKKQLLLLLCFGRLRARARSHEKQLHPRSRSAALLLRWNFVTISGHFAGSKLRRGHSLAASLAFFCSSPNGRQLALVAQTRARQAGQTLPLPRRRARLETAKGKRGRESSWIGLWSQSSVTRSLARFLDNQVIHCG